MILYGLFSVTLPNIFHGSVYYLIFNATLPVIRTCIDPNESDGVYIE